MALFESYERRIDKINAVLNSYGIASIEEAEKITKDAGLDVYNQGIPWIFSSLLSSIVTILSSLGIYCDNAFKKVVLPEPVPPLIKIL